jgi:hypothetical protein
MEDLFVDLMEHGLNGLNGFDGFDGFVLIFKSIFI